MTRTNDGIEIPKDATHLLIVCDTFSYEDYPVYTSDLASARKKYSKNMQRIKQIIPLGSKTITRG